MVDINSIEEAKKLGLNPALLKPAAKAVPVETDVVGYFNGNPFPIQIAISELGISLFLQNKGQYITNVEGKKINDPIFENYVGPHALSKEISPVKVPVVWIPRQVRAANDTGAGFVASTTVPEAGRVLQTSASATPAPDVSANPVLGMTIEEARRQGFVKKTKNVDNVGVPDNGTVDGRTQALPEISDAIPVDIPDRRTPNRKALPVAKAAPAIQEAPEHISPEAKASMEALQAAAKVDPMSQTALDEAIARNLPDPKLAEEGRAAASPIDPAVASAPNTFNNPAPPAQGDLKFVCDADGKGFRYRSELDRYVKKRYPDRYDEIMGKYPKAG